MAIDRQESPYRRGNRFDRLPIPMVTEHCIPVDAGVAVSYTHLTLPTSDLV